MEKYTDQEIIKKIKTVEDAEKLCIERESDLTDIEKSIAAYEKLCLITRQLNQGWIPDWSNFSQRKWFNWFYFASAGAYCGFSYSYSAYDAATVAANIGSRLCFKSKALAQYAAIQFKSLYEDYLLIKNN